MNSISYLFYKKYHQNKINKIIHLFCIPLIVWSFCVLFNSIHQFMTPLICLFYLIYYTYIDISTFIPMIFYLSFIYITSLYFYLIVTKAILYAIIINIFSWIMQFIGHFIFEGNRPALIDSITQSFLMAPLFSYYELKEMLD